MNNEAIGKAATIEEATEKAIEALNAPQNAEVQTEVVVFPVKKVLGLFGGKQAEVRAFYVTEDEKASVKPNNKKTRKPQTIQKKTQVLPKKENETVKAEKAQEDVAIQDLPVVAFEDQDTINYLTAILEGLQLTNIQITPRQFGDGIILDISCNEDYGILIGKRGQTLDAVQYLTSLVANRDKSDYVRINLNIGDYREKRNQTLRDLAHRAAKRVLRSGRNYILDPMNPYERRIVHTTIQDISGVTSHSVGRNNERKVIVTLEEGVKPSGQGRGRSSYQKRTESRSHYAKPVQTDENRKPHEDVQGAALYGRIDVPSAPQKDEE